SRAQATRSTPAGSGFVPPGLTIARTDHPASRNASARCHPTKPVAPVMLTVAEPFVIQPVGFVTSPSGGLDPGVDRVVVLERPRQLAVTIPARNAASVDLCDK